MAKTISPPKPGQKTRQKRRDLEERYSVRSLHTSHTPPLCCEVTQTSNSYDRGIDPSLVFSCNTRNVVMFAVKREANIAGAFSTLNQPPAYTNRQMSHANSITAPPIFLSCLAIVQPAARSKTKFKHVSVSYRVACVGRVRCQNPGQKRRRLNKTASTRGGGRPTATHACLLSVVHWNTQTLSLTYVVRMCLLFERTRRGGNRFTRSLTYPRPRANLTTTRASTQ